MNKWWMLGAAIASEVTAALSMKAAQVSSVWYVVVVVGYVGAFALLAGAMRAGMGLGVAYGIWAAAGVALTAILSAVLFGESVTITMAVGIALIMAGVLLVEVGSHRHRDARQPPSRDAP